MGVRERKRGRERGKAKRHVSHVEKKRRPHGILIRDRQRGRGRDRDRERGERKKTFGSWKGYDFRSAPKMEPFQERPRRHKIDKANRTAVGPI